MKRQSKKAGKVSEPRALYRVGGAKKSRGGRPGATKKRGEHVARPLAAGKVRRTARELAEMRDAARRMDEILARHANDPSDGKDVVTLLRELRYH